MSGERAIEIHQTVHGYRDGHELLGASLQLSGGSRRTMLGLSDLSGDGTARGFDEYLTGYPLEEAGLYVFARTWYAPEMPRPGCVWTHSLLLKVEDVESLVDPGLLRAYFRRPELGRIGARLPVVNHFDSEEVAPPAQLDGAAYEMVTRLFADDLPVLVFGEDYAQYEDTCLQLWAQQWSRLRRGFAFCTGSLEPRSIDRRSFDLQVVPLQRQRRILRAGDRYSVISEHDIAQATGPVATLSAALSEVTASEQRLVGTRFGVEGGPAHPLGERGGTEYWRGLLVQDLTRHNEPMREFLRAYTSDVPAKRVAHRHVIETWALLERVDAVSVSLRDVTAALTAGFPSSKEARKLKRAILGPDSLIRGREAELVHELLTMPSMAALDPIDLDLDDRATHLFRSGRSWRAGEIAWLLKSDELNEFGKAWASSVIEGFGAEDLASLFAEDKELFANLLLRMPTLAAQDSLWKQPREVQRAAVRALANRREGTDLQSIMFSIVRADAAGLVPDLAAELGRDVIPQLLDGIDEAQRLRNDLDEWKWASQLRGYDAELLLWLAESRAPSPWTLAFAVAVVGPHSKCLGNTPSEGFTRHLAGRSDVELAVEFIDFAAYCLSIALRNFNGDAGLVAAQAFHVVHASAIRSRLSRRAWQWLGPQLPRPGYFALENWDEGEKLRRALIDGFLRYRWSPSLLAEALRDEQTRRWVERFCQGFEGGRELLRQAEFW